MQQIGDATVRKMLLKLVLRNHAVDVKHIRDHAQNVAVIHGVVGMIVHVLQVILLGAARCTEIAKKDYINSRNKTNELICYV